MVISKNPNTWLELYHLVPVNVPKEFLEFTHPLIIICPGSWKIWKHDFSYFLIQLAYVKTLKVTLFNILYSVFQYPSRSFQALFQACPADFLERHIKIKSYQPFWCWNFLITHEFGQIFSSFALKICCSVKSSGYQTENDIFLDNMAFIWINLSISTLKGMETLKTPVNNSHLSRSNTSGS